MEINLNRIREAVTHIQKEVGKIHLNPEEYLCDTSIILKDKGKDYTTVIDLKVEDFQKKFLNKQFPNIGFFGEETGREVNGRFVWIVDPTDGTAVFATGGEYYSNSIALADRQNKKVIFGSVYQPTKNKQYLRVGTDVWISEEITNRKGQKVLIERRPVPSSSRGLPELLGCAYGTSKYYPEFPEIKKKLEKIFEKQKFPALKREYGLINAKPASGSSALFCCDIGDGARHFELIFFQKAWDLAVGALFARDAGCIVECGTSLENITGGNLEERIVDSDENTLINVGIFANKHVKEIILNKFYSRFNT